MLEYRNVKNGILVVGRIEIYFFDKNFGKCRRYRKFEAVSPYKLNSNIKRIRGSKQERYAIHELGKVINGAGYAWKL